MVDLSFWIWDATSFVAKSNEIIKWNYQMKLSKLSRFYEINVSIKLSLLPMFSYIASNFFKLNYHKNCHRCLPVWVYIDGSNALKIAAIEDEIRRFWRGQILVENETFVEFVKMFICHVFLVKELKNSRTWIVDDDIRISWKNV